MTDLEDEAPRRGPGRPRKVREDENGDEGAMVTYHPLDRGDPAELDWDGVKFEANVARKVLRQDIVAMAKTNPWFEVEGHPRAKRVVPTAEPIGPPGVDVDPVALDDRKMVEGD